MDGAPCGAPLKCIVKPRFEITIIGCGAAAPNLRFNTTAQVVNIHEKWLLLDAGEGVQLGLRKHKVPFNRINHIAISHMHGDHVLGLPGLIGSMNLLGRKTPLKLFGPEALERWLMETLRLTATYLQFDLEFHAISDGMEMIWDERTFTVMAFPTRHRIPTHGFLIREKPLPWNLKPESVHAYQLSFDEIKQLKQGITVRKGKSAVAPEQACTPPPAARSYAFAADTRPCDGVAKAVQGVNVLYHEATFKHELVKRAKETGHSTARQAAEIAAKAGVERLILGHFSARYSDLLPLVDEAKEVFGQVTLASDDAVIQV